MTDILKHPAIPCADIKVLADGQIVEPDSSLQRRFAEAGSTFERQADGRVAITNWPKPRASNPNFLSEEMEAFKAQNEESRVNTITEASSTPITSGTLNEEALRNFLVEPTYWSPDDITLAEITTARSLHGDRSTTSPLTLEELAAVVHGAGTPDITILKRTITGLGDCDLSHYAAQAAIQTLAGNWAAARATGTPIAELLRDIDDTCEVLEKVKQTLIPLMRPYAASPVPVPPTLRVSEPGRRRKPS